MRKFINATVIAAALCVSAIAGQTAAGQTQDSAPAKKLEQQTATTTEAAVKTSDAKAKDGTDCQPQRAGVKCSRRKARKPWFFGK